MKFALHETVAVVLGGGMRGMRHVVGLEAESKHVTKQKYQHDSHQNYGRFFSAFTDSDLVLVISGKTGVDGLIRVDLISSLKKDMMSLLR